MQATKEAGVGPRGADVGCLSRRARAGCLETEGSGMRTEEREEEEDESKCRYSLGCTVEAQMGVGKELDGGNIQQEEARANHKQKEFLTRKGRR